MSTVATWEFVVGLCEDVWDSLGQPLVNILAALSAVCPAQLLLVHQEQLDGALEEGQGGVDHGDVMADDGTGLVVVKEQSSPGIGSKGDVGEEVTRLKISENTGNMTKIQMIAS